MSRSSRTIVIALSLLAAPWALAEVSGEAACCNWWYPQVGDADHPPCSALEPGCSVRALLREASGVWPKEARVPKYEEALLLAEDLLVFGPDATAYELLAKAQFGAQLFEDARLTCEEWIRHFPQSWKAHHLLGQAFLAKREDTLALPHLERAIELATSPEDHKAAELTLAYAFERRHRYDEALPIYERYGELSAVARVKVNQKGWVNLDRGPQKVTEEERKALEAEKRHLIEVMKALTAGG